MSTFLVRFTLPVDVTVEIEADDIDAAIEASYKPLREFAGTIWSRHRGVAADAGLVDDLESYEVVAPEPDVSEETDRG